MSTTDELHSELGALEEQVEQLGHLKALIERLEATEDAASSAAESAEKATRANEQVVDSFNDVARRIEQSEAVEQLDDLERQIQRLEEVRGEVKEELTSFDDWLGTELEEHRSGVMESLTGELEEQSNTLSEQLEQQSASLANVLESQTEVLDGFKETFGEHESEIRSRLEEQSSVLEEHREDQRARMATLRETLEEEVRQVHSVLQDAEIVSRLERITDTSQSASQAAQNSLSRIDAVERNLSQSISQNHDRREDAEEKTQSDVAALQTQMYLHIVLSTGILAVLLLNIFNVI